MDQPINKPDTKDMLRRFGPAHHPRVSKAKKHFAPAVIIAIHPVAPRDQQGPPMEAPPSQD